MCINPNTFDPVDGDRVQWLDYGKTTYAVEGITGIGSRIAGAYYRGEKILDLVNRMKKGTALYIQAEPSNRYDKNAQAVYAYTRQSGLIHVGYVERAIAYKIAMLREQHNIPDKEHLSAKANGFGGLTVEGVIASAMFGLYTQTYMFTNN